MTVPETLHRIPLRPWRWLPWLLVSQLLVVLAWVGLGWPVGLALMVASHALFMVPVFLPNSRFYAPVLSRLPGSAPRVWLTIDDGPSPETPAVLDLLDRYQAKATFFLVGERALAQPELVRQMLARGHTLGNHSHRHPQTRFWRLGRAAMADEIAQCQQALTAIAGQPPRWYRSVVGMTNPFVARHWRSGSSPAWAGARAGLTGSIASRRPWWSASWPTWGRAPSCCCMRGPPTDTTWRSSKRCCRPCRIVA